VEWADEFVIGGSEKEFTEIRSEFQERLRRYIIEVDDDTLTAPTNLFALASSGRETELQRTVGSNDATFREGSSSTVLYGALIGRTTFRRNVTAVVTVSRCLPIKGIYISCLNVC
jgi:hypothetical protein